MNSSKQIRVLQCVGGLGHGGIETWLLNIMRAKPENLHFDFLVRVSGLEYEDEVRRLGGEVYYYPPNNRLRRIAELLGVCPRPTTLRDLLQEKSYDIVHVHGEWLVGRKMKDAAYMRIPKRIAHSHNANYLEPTTALVPILKKAYHCNFDRKKILRYSTKILACSREAGISLVGDAWNSNPVCRTIYCGVPLERFRNALAEDRFEIRRTLGIPDDAIVIGHVGNGGRAKNQLMIVRVFYEFSKRHNNAHLLMVGAGGRRTDVIELVRSLHIESKVSLVGVRDDIPSIMIHAMDAFLLPSLHEGLPVVGLEAVSAGQYVICSDRVTTEFTDFFKNRVEKIGLDRSVAHWADRLEFAVSNRIPSKEGITLVEESPFSLKASLGALLNEYGTP